MRATVKAVENVGSPTNLLVTFDVRYPFMGGDRTATLQVGVRSEQPVNIGDQYKLTLEKVNAGVE